MAGFVGGSSSVALAHRADAAVFGPAEPDHQEVRAYWADVETARHEATASLGFLTRLRAALNVTSLRD